MAISKKDWKHAPPSKDYQARGTQCQPKPPLLRSLGLTREPTGAQGAEMLPCVVCIKFPKSPAPQSFKTRPPEVLLQRPGEKGTFDWGLAD